jgi:hypothetical protein
MLKNYSFFWSKQMILLIFAAVVSQLAFAQSWMPGYNFRKKISINKSVVSGMVNLSSFPLLIEFEDPDLREALGCGHNRGLDISFATAEESSIPINFQLDNYDAAKGKLTCWVKVNELITSSNAGINELYLYYGSNQIHNPFSIVAQNTWSDSYQQVWHLNLDTAPSTSYSANHSSGTTATGTPGMGRANFPAARIGAGVLFNGVSDALIAATDTNTTVCITAWVKPNQIGTEQVILANDSATGGYRVKINPSGNLVLESLNFLSANSIATTTSLAAGTWYHIALIFNKGIKRIYVNGEYKAGGGVFNSKLGRGGKVSVGRSKQNDKYFNGAIDELRIQHIERGIDWFATEYRNQQNPDIFFSISAREINPVQTAIVNEFTGAAGTENWTDEGNWSHGKLPENYSGITVKAGTRLKIAAGAHVALNKLIVETGAIISLAGSLEANCTATVEASASIILADGAQLIFKQDVSNNGSITLNQTNGTIIFSGNHELQTFSGTGSCAVSRFEMNMASAGQTVLLQAKISVSRQLELIRGTLNANGNLTLLSTGTDHNAALMPVQNTGNASVIGQVNVQRFIDGDFAAPSTARGWWLLASPVYHSIINGTMQYGLSAIKESIFVTGAGGVNNGFDPSPNNKATIYTHDQSLPGTLSQKYTAIPDMHVNVPLGKGFYAFSRGDRDVADAYRHQIQGPLFSNPQPYTITYTGKLFTGDLTVPLFNKNTGAEGDGFNLLGNPYASAITWGGLQKVNVGPFIWVFDPKNNAYQVTDDPGYIINPGAGFFVRVNNGNATGSLTFRETAKYTGPTTPATPMLAAIHTGFEKRATLTSRLSICVSRAGLSDAYVLILRPGGENEINDADAQKIGEGYLGIAGLAANGNKLSVDERAADTTAKTIKLYVKGWASGNYTLDLKGTFKPDEQVTLVDHYLNLRKPVSTGDLVYPFYMDMGIAGTYGGSRFSLRFEQLRQTTDQPAGKSILIYPNPFNNEIYLKSDSQTLKSLKVVIRNITGNVVWNSGVTILDAGIPLQLLCGHMMKGIYFLQLIDPKTNKVLASFKTLKN